MSLLHSIVPLEHIFMNEFEYMPRFEMTYHNMLVEVEYQDDHIVLNRIIDAPLHNYLDDQYKPGTIIGKRQLLG